MADEVPPAPEKQDDPRVYRGTQRPKFAHTPEPGQESVWDYPRPPAIEENYLCVQIYAGRQIIADSKVCFRVLETACAPAYYLPGEDIALNWLIPLQRRSVCEWKGRADYWCLKNDPRKKAVAWCYPRPCDSFTPITGCFAFYPALLRCYLAGERVQPQPGGFYGGWITRGVTGPFKGEPGSENW